MNIFLVILLIVVFTFILKTLIASSFTFIFIVFKKPNIWIIFMGLLSFLYFFIGSMFNNFFNIIWWSALLAFMLSIPSKAKENDVLNQKEMNKIVDEMYDAVGAKKGRLQRKIGLFAYLIGGVLGWIIFYGEIATNVVN